MTIETKTKSDENPEIIHHKNSRKNKKVFNRNEYESKEILWSLQKYIGEEIYNGIDWQYQGSAQELSNGLTALKIVSILNSDYVFDFDYEPNENDLLSIKLDYLKSTLKGKSRPFIGEYISFIFKNGKWEINNGYDHISKVYKNYKEGKIIYIT
ncbi:hypothetical protein H9X54_008000 [Flavobacterium macrobrachii]|uniref:Uncharacterized protein n=1 Tax=Flavobacterium macrobrachii TaxID=591204 RepID=A0ABS2CWB7_9FLAO|nr:hypothetical protein [Flavobacterium macrobrachii]MBM6499243.1 hypothetical protein [Flavobacterium macrobrachii]